MSNVAEKKKNVYTLEEMIGLIERKDLKEIEVKKFRRSINLEFINYYSENVLTDEENEKFVNATVQCFNKTKEEYYQRETVRYDMDTDNYVFDLFSAKKYLIENYLTQLKAEDKSKEKEAKKELQNKMNSHISKFLKKNN